MENGSVALTLHSLNQMERVYGNLLPGPWELEPYRPDRFKFGVHWKREAFMQQRESCDLRACCWCGDPVGWL